MKITMTKFFIAMFVLAFAITLLGMQFTSASLGTFKQNDCVNIIVPLNASVVTLTNVNNPAPNSSTIISNQAMSGSNNFFNYTFCNTTNMGTYTYGYCDQSGNCYGNDFIINGSGQNVSQSQIIFIIIGIVVLLIVVLFFFILGIMFKHPGTKIFFMAMSVLTLMVVIGLFTSNAIIYLAEFTGLVEIYNNYYILMMILSGVAMLGVMIWLVYFGVNTFNKTRGKIPEDD